MMGTKSLIRMTAATRTAAAARSVVVQQQQKRSMGGFNPNMGVTKNKYIEEWNGKREMTEQSFRLNSGNIRQFFMFIVLFPFTVYSISRAEFQTKGDRRYQDTI